MESPVRVREHIKKDESGKVILTEIHRETLPPDIKGAMWWLERRFPEQFGRRDQMEHAGKVAVQATQTKERKLTIELVNSDGEVHRLTRDDVMTVERPRSLLKPTPKPEPAHVVPQPYTLQAKALRGLARPRSRYHATPARSAALRARKSTPVRTTSHRAPSAT